jgi:hypothetical protein
MQVKPGRLVSRSEDRDGIFAHLRRRRHVGERSAVRATESKLAVRLSIDLVALFVDRAVVPAAEHGEIRQRGGAALGPVTDVMALADANLAAREAAAAVPVVEGRLRAGGIVRVGALIPLATRPAMIGATVPGPENVYPSGPGVKVRRPASRAWRTRRASGV